MKAFAKLKLDDSDVIYDVLIECEALSIQNNVMTFLNMTVVELNSSNGQHRLLIKDNRSHKWKMSNIIEFKMLEQFKGDFKCLRERNL